VASATRSLAVTWTPLGQLDLVAMDGKTLVFVEVKTRAGHGFGLPQEAVDAKKIRKLR
jgi:putative endonuclease